MTKQQALDVLMLLSALESWSYSAKERLPDYLHDRLQESVDVLVVDVIGPNPQGGEA